MKFYQRGITDWTGAKILHWGQIPDLCAMVCPETDKLCKDPECKESGCLEQREEEGEESKDG